MPEFRSLRNLLASPEPVSWAVPELLPCRGLAFIGAPPKSAKTVFALNWAYALAGGRAFMRGALQPMRVLYVERELGMPVISTRLASIHSAAQSDAALDNLALHCRSKHAISLTPNSLGLANLAAMVAEFRPTIVMLDPLRNFFTGDENDSDAAMRVVGSMYDLADRFECAFVVVHHTGKPKENGAWSATSPEALRGSSHFFAAGDSYLMIQRTGNFSLTVHFTLRHSVWAPLSGSWEKDRYLCAM